MTTSTGADELAPLDRTGAPHLSSAHATARGLHVYVETDGTLPVTLHFVPHSWPLVPHGSSTALPPDTTATPRIADRLALPSPR